MQHPGLLVGSEGRNGAEAVQMLELELELASRCTDIAPPWLGWWDAASLWDGGAKGGGTGGRDPGTPQLCQPQHRGLTSVPSFTGHRAEKWSMRVPK